MVKRRVPKRRTRKQKINAKHVFSYTITHDVKGEIKKGQTEEVEKNKSAKFAVRQAKDNESQNIFKPFIRSLIASILILTSLVVLYSFS